MPFAVYRSLFTVYCLLIMLRVGLTGSIGVGKSFVASVLADLGCHVLDADDTAREVVAPGSAGLRRVVAEFGAEYLARCIVSVKHMTAQVSQHARHERFTHSNRPC